MPTEFFERINRLSAIFLRFSGRPEKDERSLRFLISTSLIGAPSVLMNEPPVRKIRNEVPPIKSEGLPVSEARITKANLLKDRFLLISVPLVLISVSLSVFLISEILRISDWRTFGSD